MRRVGRAGLLAWLVAASWLPAVGGQLGHPADEGGRVRVRPRPGTVAVMPFTNISGDGRDEWLGAGIAETVATDLEQLSHVSVIRPMASLDPNQAWPGAGLDDATARARVVSWIVTGGFQRLGAQLRITAWLVDVERGMATDAIKVDGHVDMLFALQDRIAEQLRDRLSGVWPALSVGGIPPATEMGAAHRPPEEAPTGRPTGHDVTGPPAVARLNVGPLAAGPSTPRAGPDGEADAGESAEASDPRVPVAPSPAFDDRRSSAGGVSGATAGDIVIGASRPALGVATGVGILTGRPSVRPPRTAVGPTIDGRLDDAVWTRAAYISEFVQITPLDGAPASEASDVYIAYDSNNIYLGFHAHFSDPRMLRANRKDRDVRTGDDTFWVYFDPFLDQQRAYSFGVNAYGVQLDAIVSTRGGGGSRGRGRGGGGRGGGFRRGPAGPGGGLPRGDHSWDVLFDSAGQIVPDGFTAEMAIPFKSLRYPQRAGTTPHQWGFQIARRIRGRNETAVWAPISREVAGFLPQMGVIHGMTGLSTSQNFEVLPTFTAVQFGSLNERATFVDKDVQPEGGLNLKYGVTSDLTADATFNPDFSQVESDQPQIEINQRFALFFPELRPFFLEGAEIFDFQAPVRPVHTRTIVDPRYGAKLTGKNGNTTIGVMYANDEAAGNVEDVDHPVFGHSAHTLVGRARYDLYSESHVGGILTDREFLDSHSRLAGLDAGLRLGDTHELTLQAFGTQHRDLDGIDMSGHMLNAFMRKTGRNLSYLIAGYSLSPDFKTDVGFVDRTDQQRTVSELAYRWWPETWLLSWSPRVRYDRSHNFEGILDDERVSAGADLAFADSINVNGDLNREMERFAGIAFGKTRYQFRGVISTLRQFSFGVGGSGGDQIFFDAEHPYLGRDIGWNAFINLRLIPQLESRINIDTNRFTDPRNQDEPVFDVKIFRALTTYQFTDRFLLRNISEYNSFDKKLGLNLLFTYRVNAGTVFYVGYDDRYQQADRIEPDLQGDSLSNRFFQSAELIRTSRAIFTKVQYLFRY